MEARALVHDSFGSRVRRRTDFDAGVRLVNSWEVVCRRPEGIHHGEIVPRKLFPFLGKVQPNTWAALRRDHGRRVEDRVIEELQRDIARRGHYATIRDGFDCFGRLVRVAMRQWHNRFGNLVTNEGESYLLKAGITGESTADSTWFIGLLADGSAPAETWTATEVGSNDFTSYDETTLQAYSGSNVSSGSTNNNASPASFTISVNSSIIAGGYMISTNAKATPAGTVYAAGTFSGGDKSADDNDVLDVKVTLTVT